MLTADLLLLQNCRHVLTLRKNKYMLYLKQRCIFLRGYHVTSHSILHLRNPNWCVSNALNDPQTQPWLKLYDKSHLHSQGTCKEPHFCHTTGEKGRGKHRRESLDVCWRKQFCPAIAWDRQLSRLVFVYYHWSSWHTCKHLIWSEVD